MPPSSCRVLQRRSFLIAGDALPRAPLPLQDSSSHDGHFSRLHLPSLFSAHPRSFSRLFSLSLALLSRGHSVSTRGTPLRAREWRLSRLARPFQRAGAIPSFLPACHPACLPTCLYPPLIIPYSHSLSLSLAPTLTCSPACLEPTTAVVPALAVTLTA